MGASQCPVRETTVKKTHTQKINKSPSTLIFLLQLLIILILHETNDYMINVILVVQHDWQQECILCTTKKNATVEWWAAVVKYFKHSSTRLKILKNNPAFGWSIFWLGFLFFFFYMLNSLIFSYRKFTLCIVYKLYFVYKHFHCVS